MQMNHRININSHHELKEAEAFKRLENTLVVLQKKKFLTILTWAFLYTCIYNGRNLSWGTFFSAKLLQDPCSQYCRCRVQSKFCFICSFALVPACGRCSLLNLVGSSNLSRNSYLLMNWFEIIYCFPINEVEIQM